MQDERTKHPRARCTFEHVTLCLFSWSCKDVEKEVASVARVRLHTTPVSAERKQCGFF